MTTVDLSKMVVVCMQCPEPMRYKAEGEMHLTVDEDPIVGGYQYNYKCPNGHWVVMFAPVQQKEAING